MPGDLVDLDISSAKAYLSSMGLLRQSIIFGREKSSGHILTLRVHLPYGNRVTVYMKCSNMYIVAFGINPVYALKDDTEDIPKTLRAAGVVPKETKIEQLALGSDHGSLGTENYEFGWGDLAQCSALDVYNGSQSYNMIRKPLSLLVCILAEAARFLEVQNAFAGVSRKDGEYWSRPHDTEGLYGLNNISISGVVWVWQKASRLRGYTTTAGVGPEGGKRLVAQLNALIAELATLLGEGGGKLDREVVLRRIADSPPRAGASPSVAAAKLFEAKQLAARFGAITKEQISDVLLLFGDELVMKAVQGLLMPAV